MAIRTRRQLWDQIAFCARHGHQPIRDLLSMSIVDLDSFTVALYRLIEAEVPSGD